MGGAFFLASLHIFLIPSDTSAYLPLRIYMLGLAALGLLAFSYRTLLGWLVVKKYDYVVTEVVDKNRDIVEIAMAPQKNKLRFVLGQFIFINFISGAISSESHPFSIISSPDESSLRVAVKKSGDYTGKITDLSAGDTARIEGPFGVFSYTRGIYKNQVWIAGGIGITPFFGMARSMRQDEGYVIDLYYCVKNEQEAVYMNELRKVGQFMRVIPFYSDENGYINAELIRKKSGSLTQKDIFICAPQPMIQSLKSQFKNIGINKQFIHSEEFYF